MGYSEFPHTRYGGETDMTEFIRLYETLVSDYSGTLKSISDLQTRLTSYESSMTSNYNNMLNNTIPTKVEESVIAKLAPFRQDIDGLSTRVDGFDSRLNEMKTMNSEQHSAILDEVSRMNIAIRALVSELDAKVDALELSLKQEIAENSEFLQGRIEQERVKTDKQIADVNAYVRTEHIAAQELSERYTDEQIRRVLMQLEQLEVMSDKTAIEWLWNNAVTYGGYSADEWYNDVYVTCDDFNNIENMTALNFYIRGKDLTKWFDRRTYIYSPFTGKLSSTNDVLLQTIDYIRKNLALTAKEYDEIEATATEYDAVKITAFEYDFKGKEIIRNAHTRN